jgi:hypothetical protein
MLKELTEIYSTPTPKGGTRPIKSKDTILIDVMMFITIAGVRYLYPSPRRIRPIIKLEKEDKNFLDYDNVDLTLSLL